MLSIKRKSFRAFFSIALIGIASFTYAIDFLDLPAIKTGLASKGLLLDVTARGEDTFAAVGEYGVIVISDDGGSSWTQANVPVSVMLTGVDFPTSDLGWAVGHDGLILHSADGGLSWEKQLDGHQLNQQIISVAENSVKQFRDELEKLRSQEAAVTETGNAASDADEVLTGDVLAEATEEAEYQLEEAEFMLEGSMDDVEAGPVRPLLGVWFKNKDEGFVVGSYGMLLHTTDSGENWQLVSDRMDNPEGFHLNQIIPAPDGNLYISGESGFVYRSADGGLSWDSLEPGYAGSFYGIVVVPGNSDGYELLVYGLQGNLFSSTDKGESWNKVNSGTTVTLMAGTTLEDGAVIIAGQAGILLYRPAGSNTFKPASNEDKRVISGISLLANNNILLAGGGGIRMASSDGTSLATNPDK